MKTLPSLWSKLNLNPQKSPQKRETERYTQRAPAQHILGEPKLAAAMSGFGEAEGAVIFRRGDLGVAAEGEVMAELLDALHGGGWFGGRRGFNAGTGGNGETWALYMWPLGTESETDPTRSHLQR